MKRWLALVAIALAPATFAGPFEDVPTLRAMKDELTRAMDKLELAPFGKPYFLSYQMWDVHRTSVIARFGALVATRSYPHRTLDIDLRIGDATFDNSNVAEPNRLRGITLPIDDNYEAVRHQLWLATDRMYKSSAETLERKRAVAKGESKRPDDAGAFSTEPATHVVDDHPVRAIELAKAETLAKRLSAVFRANPDIHDGTVAITAMAGKQYFVSSEGSASLQSGSFVRIDVTCSSQAGDGMAVHDSRAFFVETLDQLPPEAELVAEVEKLSRELSAMRAAPIVDDYSGPVLFAGVAPGQVLRTLLAENFSGTPAPRRDRPGASAVGESELVGKIGQRILPAGVTVVDDPTAARAGKSPLVGRARFDEEGVPAQKVSLVENGVFKRFLMSRIPRKGFEHSNGHAASTPWSSVRAHPMNLIVASTAGVSDAEIRRRAIAAATAQGLGYVLVVERLDMHQPTLDMDIDFDAFSGDDGLAKPAVLKRVYRDGREEYVRGATFGAMPMRTLKDVTAVGATPVVYSYVGSGIPSRFGAFMERDAGYFVSIAAPPLLFRDIDVKKPTGSHRSAPVAPRPK